jgi:hypothetical protein
MENGRLLLDTPIDDRLPDEQYAEYYHQRRTKRQETRHKKELNNRIGGCVKLTDVRVFKRT